MAKAEVAPRRLVTRIEQDTFRRLRLAAVLSDRTIQELVEEALRTFLDAQEDRNA